MYSSTLLKLAAGMAVAGSMTIAGSGTGYPQNPRQRQRAAGQNPAAVGALPDRRNAAQPYRQALEDRIARRGPAARVMRAARRTCVGSGDHCAPRRGAESDGEDKAQSLFDEGVHGCSWWRGIEGEGCPADWPYMGGGCKIVTHLHINISNQCN